MERHHPPSFATGHFAYVSPKAFHHQLPSLEGVPEVAFLGRSNVGKSSLMNSLMRRRKNDLARVSKTPGRTQQVSYFALLSQKAKQALRAGDAIDDSSPIPFQNLPQGSLHGFLIDLPGYGFASAPENKIDGWQEKTQQFLLARRDFGSLCMVYLLVDSRRSSLTSMDRAVMGWFDEAEIPYTVVITKTDAMPYPSVVRLMNEVCMRFATHFHEQTFAGSASFPVEPPMLGAHNDEVASLEADHATGGEEYWEHGHCHQAAFVHATSAKKGDGVAELMWSIHSEFASFQHHDH